MSKVRGALFSLTASGKLGDMLIFQGGMGATRVYPHKPKRDPKSPAQLSHRASYQSAVSYWRALNEDERDFYSVLGGQHAMTGYNYFMKMYLLGKDVPPLG